MFKLGIDVGATNTKFIYFEKNISNYSEAKKITISTSKNIVSDDVSYLNYNKILKTIITQITDIGQEKISLVTISGQMHSSMLLNNSEIIDGPHSWQSEKNPDIFDQISSNKNILDLKRGYPIFNISNLEGMYATLLTKIFGDLTGNYSLIHQSEAAGTGFFDFKKNDWEHSIISNFIPKIILPQIVNGVQFYKLNNSHGKISLPFGDFQMSMADNISDENTLSINIATGGQIAIIKRKKNSLFQTRPSINNNYSYDCITQLPAGRLIDLYLKSTNSDLLSLSNRKFNESILKKSSICPDLFSKKEMIMYLQNLTEKYQSQADDYLLSSLLKKYAYLINLYKKEYNFNKIVMSGSIIENYNFIKDGLKHIFHDIEIKYNKNDVLKTHFFLLKNNDK